MTTAIVVAAESAAAAEALVQEQFVAWAALPDERGVSGTETELVNLFCVGRMRALNVEQPLWQVNVLHQTKP